MVESTDKPSKGLPTAQEVMEKLALAEGEKASQAARKHAADEAEKKARQLHHTVHHRWSLKATLVPPFPEALMPRYHRDPFVRG